MFKYFVYNSSEKFLGSATNSISDNDRYLVNQLQLEVSNCYNNLFSNCSVSNAEPCSGNPCNYFHESWSSGQKLMFYQQISNARKCPSSCDSEPLPVMLETSENALTSAEINTMIANILIDASNTCDSRLSEFKNEITSSLENACYVIVDCKDSNGPNYQVSASTVDNMSQKAVAKCKEQITTIQNNYTNHLGQYSSEYPWSNTETCVYLKDDFTCTTSTKMNYQLFPECDQVIIDQANSWNFSVNITPCDHNNDGLINSLDCPNFVSKDWATPSNLSNENQNCNTKVNTSTGVVVSSSNTISN
jgi:hypothetical protein